MEACHQQIQSVGKRLISLIALALNLDEDYFEKIGAFDKPEGYLRLLRYSGQKGDSDEEIHGAHAHSDYGMMTIVATDGVPGLQECLQRKFKLPHIWEDVSPLEGAFVVNLGDMIERWTNGLFRSTLHRVIPTGERYSVAFFLDPNPDCIVQCLESCCDESSPPKYPPIRCGDYFSETYGSDCRLLQNIHGSRMQHITYFPFLFNKIGQVG